MRDFSDSGETAGQRLKKHAQRARLEQTSQYASDVDFLAFCPPSARSTRWLGIPLRYRAVRVRLARGEGSPRQAIKAQCLECCGFDREAVRTCPAQACPLWRYRPGA